MLLLLSRLSCVGLCATLWTAAYWAPLYMGFSRKEYQSELPPPGDLSNPGIKPGSPALQADYLPSEPPNYVLLQMPSTVNGILWTPKPTSNVFSRPSPEDNPGRLTSF